MSGFRPWQATGPTKHSVAKKTPCACGTVHDSRKEARRCADLRMLEIAGSIVGLRQQPFFAFSIDGRDIRMENGHRAGITADFAYFELPGERLIVEDVKPASKKADSRDYPLRKAIFKAQYPDVIFREVR